jgi:hypothetical protein
MPLYAVLARESFGQAVMGNVFGAMTMLSSIGMAFGPSGRGTYVRRLQQLHVTLHWCVHRGARRGDGRLRLLGPAATAAAGDVRDIPRLDRRGHCVISTFPFFNCRANA